MPPSSRYQKVCLAPFVCLAMPVIVLLNHSFDIFHTYQTDHFVLKHEFAPTLSLKPWIFFILQGAKLP